MSTRATRALGTRLAAKIKRAKRGSVWDNFDRKEHGVICKICGTALKYSSSTTCEANIHDPGSWRRTITANFAHHDIRKKMRCAAVIA